MKTEIRCGLSVENFTTRLIFMYKPLWPNIYEYVNKLGMFEQKLATGKYCNVEFIVPTKSLISQPQHIFRSAIQGAHEPHQECAVKQYHMKRLNNTLFRILRLE